MGSMQEFADTSTLFGSNAPFIEELYESYLADPGSVSDEWRRYFDELRGDAADVPHAAVVESFRELARNRRVVGAMVDETTMHKQVLVLRLISKFRTLGMFHADLDPWRFAPAGELPRIAHQVLEQRLQQGAVAARLHAGLDVQVDDARRLRIGEPGTDFLRQRAEVDVDDVESATPDARQLEQRVDQFRHAAGRLAHAAEVVLPGRVEAVGVAFAEDPAEALDRAQRRAQVVRHAVGEGFQFAVGLAELARARGHAGLQRPVERLHRILGAHALGHVVHLH